ncbi:SRPBCC family protein [Nocardia sp. NPDC051052]|uniref:SRPBCC family protein n=1 Tax=Nocardia sp. NPDC051052 TaxID=3364322 RepID=UPI0037A43DCD
MSVFTVSLSTSVVINSPARRVWDELTDLRGYRDWNPYYREADGTVELGSKVVLKASLPSGRSATSRCTVTSVQTERELAWISSFGLPRLMDATHSFLLTEDENGGTLLTQHETFSGLLVPLSGQVVEDVKEACDGMARALKARIEE